MRVLLVFLLAAVLIVSGCTSLTGGFARDSIEPTELEMDFCENVVCGYIEINCDGIPVLCQEQCKEGLCIPCTPHCPQGYMQIAEAQPDPEPQDLCADMSCPSNKITCPDGSILECENTCDPETGICSTCTPPTCPAIPEPVQTSTPPAPPTPPTSEPETQPEPEPEASFQISSLDCVGETITVTGTGDLSSWTIHDEGEKYTYAFPSGTILSGSSVTINSGPDADYKDGLFWTLRSVWNNDGDTAYLVNQQGQTVTEKSC